MLKKIGIYTGTIVALVGVSVVMIAEGGLELLRSGGARAWKTIAPKNQTQ